MDSSAGAVLSLDAVNHIEGWLATPRPRLFVRCKEKATEVYVATGVSANPEVGLNDAASVRTRLDDQPPESEVWDESTDGHSLFARYPMLLVSRILKARKFRLEFVPFNSSPQVVEFNVQGLSKVISAVATPCGWDGSDETVVAPTNPHPAVSVHSAPAFVPVGWSGKGRTKTATELFDVPISTWHVSWAHKGAGQFLLQVCDDKGHVVTSVTHVGTGEGDLDVNAPPGKFYLVPMGDEWAVTTQP